MLQSSAFTEIRLTPDHIHRGNLVLVNGSLPLMTCRRPRLTPVAGLKQSQEETVFLDSTAACLLQSILQEIRSDGSIVPVSGYRNFLHQRQIYENSLKESGVDFTLKYVALPGCSEHQTGLAVDLGLRQDHVDYICPEFPYEGICQSFRQRASEYGFIERYKAEKTSITGIAAEPWHFRYVGYPHSVIMAERSLSLEEYIEFLRRYPYQENHLQICMPESRRPENRRPENCRPENCRSGNRCPENLQSPGRPWGRDDALSGSPIRFEIFFVAMDKLKTWEGCSDARPGGADTANCSGRPGGADTANCSARPGGAGTAASSADTAGLSIKLPADKIYQISGNNDDGCIITIWN